jgi:hypothetical protein
MSEIRYPPGFRSSSFLLRAECGIDVQRIGRRAWRPLFGFDTAVISGTTDWLKSHFNLSDANLGLRSPAP